MDKERAEFLLMKHISGRLTSEEKDELINDLLLGLLDLELYLCNKSIRKIRDSLK